MSKLILLSFVVGAAVGAFGAELYLRNKYEAIVQEELESIKESYEGVALNKLRAEIKQDGQKVDTIIKNYETEKAQVIYDPGDLGGIVPMSAAEEAALNLPDMMEPYLISDDQYNEEKLVYDKLELNYYMGDGCLVDERDELVDDFMQLIGAAPEVLFAEVAETDNSSVIYVRNEQTSADYEVLLNDGKFEDSIGWKRGHN